MTFYEAALAVLRSAGRPLSTAEITERALAAGLITTSGRTPEATMSAALYKAAASSTELKKLDEPGQTRARRGTVRWSLGGAPGTSDPAC